MGEGSASACPARIHPNVAEVRGLGMMIGIELVATATLEPFPPTPGWPAGSSPKVCAASFLPRRFRRAQDVIMLGPPFIIDEDDIALMVTALEESIDEAVSRSGAAPK